MSEDSLESIRKLVERNDRLIAGNRRLTEKVEELERDQLKFYKVDGSYEILASVEDVVKARKECAVLIESQATQLAAKDEECERLRTGLAGLISEARPVFKIYDDDYAEHEMPTGYPSPDGLFIRLTAAEQALNANQDKGDG